MPNRLHFDNAGRERELFYNLGPADYQSLLTALESIQNDPLPDNDRIVAVDFPPIVIYHYRDEKWRIAYGLSYYRVGETEGFYDIGIVAVSPVQG